MKPNMPGNLLKTAMAVMPHTDVVRALDIALVYGRAFLVAIATNDS